MHTPKPRAWNFSNKALLECVEAVKKKKKINREYDIPLLAGYSKDGETLYIDKDFQDGYVGKDGKYIHAINGLLFHEGVEKALMEYLGIGYEPTHEVALRAEYDAAEALGADAKEYNGWMEKYIKIAKEKKEFSVPKNLDLEPYKKETEIMKRMKSHDPTTSHR